MSTSGLGADGPLLSIVIPTMNSSAVLGGALQSLAQQTCRDFEVIISDGASTDATQAIAQDLQAGLPHLRIDSQRDSGVYDAINRGVALSRGEWFLVLGSDDRLHASDTLAAVAAQLRAGDGAQLVYGDVRMMAVNKCVAPGARYAGPLSLKRMFRTNICQQAIFYRRTLFDTLGGFDLRYKLYADWDFNLRAFFRVPVRWIDVVVADYAATGMSATGTDPVFMDALPGKISDELISRIRERDLWPLHYHLLRDANWMRRRGQPKQAWGLLRSYLRLMAMRMAILAKRA